ncbi:MAG: PAS domain S-box protein [Calditrichales bacterium]|nr:MAG: PAS domain S-box protein [Calditrichales bacterium]
MRMATAFGELAAIALSNGRTRDELKKSEERFRAVVQTASDAIINIDREGMITFWNEAATEIFGYDLNEIFGRSITCLLPERFRKAHTDGITRFLKTGQSKIIGTTVEMAALRRNGEEFPVGLSLSEWKLGEEICFTGIIRDISIQKQMERDLRTSMDSLEDKVRERTAELSEINEILNQKIEERRKAEETLETERQRLFSVLDEIPASIHLLADDHTIRFANRYFRTQFGDYTQAPCYQIKQGNDTPCNSCRTFDVFRTGEPNELEDWYADGQLYRIYNYPFKDVDGSDLILQLGIDITKQKEAENDLRESEERFKVLVNSMNDTVFTLNNDKRIKEVYGRGLEKIGYQINEVIGKRINQIFGDIDNPIHLQAIKKVFAGNNDVYEWQIETSPYGKRYIQNSMAPIYDESGSIEGLVGVARDITLQKTLEQQLIQTEKLMAVAQMSAMIAHEFRNALTSLRMILELQMESVTITKSEKKALTVALDSVSHMEGIITELVDFSRPSPMTFSTVDISHLIEESILLIKPHCAKYKVNLEENLAENIPVLRADPIRLKETFVNILLNAVQALSSGNQDNRQKKVQIESEQLTVEKNLKNEPGNSGAPANGSAGSSNHMIKKGTACVRITVSDNGSGIAEKNLKHIFDPFFTTKIGGTGLGMHIVHRTVQAHGGIIRIKNLQPGGTKIAIYLPIKGHH